MNILVFGDVVGSAGRKALAGMMPFLREKYFPDLIIVNGENSADGNGVSPESADELYRLGADVITTGNHAFRRRDISDEFDKKNGLIRPANFHPSACGEGFYLFERGKHRALVINLMGEVFLDVFESPFITTERLLSENDCKTVVIDFHGEATAEKIAFARHFDKKASLIFGTHTHVQTADEQILPEGCGYITDVGMCGPKNSVLGVKPELAIRKMITKLPVTFENADGPCIINGLFAVTDDTSGRCVSVERLSFQK